MRPKRNTDSKMTRISNYTPTTQRIISIISDLIKQQNNPPPILYSVYYTIFFIVFNQTQTQTQKTPRTLLPPKNPPRPSFQTAPTAPSGRRLVVEAAAQSARGEGIDPADLGRALVGDVAHPRGWRLMEWRLMGDGGL